MAYNEQLGYHDETQALIERMCANVERDDFRLNKAKAAECILRTYDLFGLERPKSVTWVSDPSGAAYMGAASSARLASSALSARLASSALSAWSALSASSASSAWSASSARSASSAWSASSARSAWSAWSASSALSARSALSASSAWSARSALDFDFGWFILGHQYCLDPTDNPPNESDRKYLEYCELLMRAKEYGAGYRVEHKDILYIAPTPLVKIDSQNRFHSDEGPAISWKAGSKHYFLYGAKFDYALWKRITSGNFTAKELMEIDDSDQRSIALNYLVPADLLKELRAVHLHTGKKGNKLYRCDNYLGSGKTEYALWMRDASTPREFVHFAPKDFDHGNDADMATAGMYRTADGRMLPLEDYLNIGSEWEA